MSARAKRRRSAEGARGSQDPPERASGGDQIHSPAEWVSASGLVVAVARDGAHRFGKPVADEVLLVAGRGVDGDAHAGVTVQHRSRVARDPSQPNLRQVHLIAAELIDELVARGFRVRPGAMGENVTTCGVDLLALPAGARLRLGGDAVVEITGLRNPCRQLDAHQDGLMRAVLDRGPDGELPLEGVRPAEPDAHWLARKRRSLVRRAGVMGIVLAGGTVRAGDPVAVRLPAPPHAALEPV